MRFIGIIPVRMASTRFPGKPLTPICGKPMLHRVYDAVAAARFMDLWYVATPDAEIAVYCQQNNLKYILTATTCRNGTERCLDAMRQIAMRDPDDIVINVQGDEPLIRPESLTALASAFVNTDVKIASLYFKPSSPAFMSEPNRVKVLVGESGDALAFTRRVGSPALWRLYGQHVGVYGYRRDLLPGLVKMEPIGDLEQLAWMCEGIPVRMVEIGYETVAVDRPEDVLAVESRL